MPTSPAGPLKPVEWVGSALEDLRGLPPDVQDVCGYALHQAQVGKHHPAAKRLRGELGGLVELVDDFDGDTYRAVYTVKFAGVIYVLHVFQKKSKHGIGTPRREIALIRERFQRAKAHYAAHDAAAGETHG
jgi:phage-related protein